MRFEVEENVLKATINYLVEKPFKETAQLINALQKSKPIEEKKEKPLPVLKEEKKWLH